MSPTNPMPGVSLLRLFVIERRHRLGFRQVDLAEHCRLSHPWVASFESGRKQGTPRRDTVIQLARGLCLPRETPGLLLTFLEIVLTGNLDPHDVREVAKGEKDAFVVVTEATQKGQAIQIRSYSPSDLSAQLFHSNDLRLHRLEKALALIQEDLSPQDFTIASAMLRRLYEQPAHQQQPPSKPRSAPRRRERRQTDDE